MNEADLRQRKIILFDGVCNLCAGSIVFILKRERSPAFQFASIQAEAGRELLKWCGLPEGFDQAIVLIEHGQVYLGSTAALKIGGELRSPWAALSRLGFLIPEFLRDWVYRQIAGHRYQWFGKKDVCILPTDSLKTRFL
jgi:predicted DCC family thiol-disulfide oxidoreductase YuxK